MMRCNVFRVIQGSLDRSVFDIARHIAKYPITFVSFIVEHAHE